MFQLNVSLKIWNNILIGGQSPWLSPCPQWRS